MSLISASIPNMINGVSQQPPSLRLKTQASLQENGLASVVDGLSKRPGTEFINHVLSNVQNIDDAFIHTVRRDDNEYYTLIVTDSAMYVIDRDGIQRTLTNNTSYLSGLTNPKKELAATTIADYTFLVNKTKTVAEGTATSPARAKEALVYVKQADYTCKYELKLTKAGTVYTRSIETKSSTQDANSDVQKAEASVQSDRIAKNLIFSNAVESTYYGTGANSVNIPGTSFTQYGNVIHIVSTDGQDFDITTTDSRGDTQLFSFKGTTGDFKKLPPTGPNGFVIGVVGDNNKGQDDYYVKLQTTSTGQQVWKETVAPNVKLNFNASTMPHQLVSEANGTFTFEPVPWKDRKVGDDTTNPMPSFVGYKISDIFFHRNRLGFLADENVIFAEAGEFDEFNFFKKTVLSVVDSDPIDVAVANNQISLLKFAVPFNESLLLFSDLTQFRLKAQDLLTPETISIDVTTQFEASLETAPVGAGRYVFFATNRGKWSGIREYFVDVSADVDDAADITAHVPNYLPGVVDRLQASSNEDMLLAHCAEDPNAIYVYRYYWQGTEKLQSSWSRWAFKGKVLNFSFNKSDIDILINYTDDEVGYNALSLERINLSEDEAVSLTTQSHAVHLDKRWIVQGWSSGQTAPKNAAEAFPGDTYGGNDEPLYVAYDGKELTYDEYIAYLDGYPDRTVFIGYPFTFKYELSEQVVSNNNEPIATGRLQLRNMTLLYSNTGEFETHVTPTGRATSIKKFKGRILGAASLLVSRVSLETGKFKFPILSKSDEVKIELISESFLPLSFQSAEWEGYFTVRSRKL
jgi:hypothetical protein